VERDKPRPAGDHSHGGRRKSGPVPLTLTMPPQKLCNESPV
jgi:hypothetical protein